MSNNKNDNDGCVVFLICAFLFIGWFAFEDGLLQFQRYISPCTYEVNKIIVVDVPDKGHFTSSGITIPKKDHCDDKVYIELQDFMSIPQGFRGKVKIKIINIKSTYSYIGKIVQLIPKIIQGEYEKINAPLLTSYQEDPDAFKVKARADIKELIDNGTYDVQKAREVVRSVLEEAGIPDVDAVVAEIFNGIAIEAYQEDRKQFILLTWRSVQRGIDSGKFDVQGARKIVRANLEAAGIPNVDETLAEIFVGIVPKPDDEGDEE